jgi:hypothetical protein
MYSWKKINYEKIRRHSSENMTLRDAQREIANATYLATGLFEQLEQKNKIFGNGHHIRQEVASFAEQMMLSVGCFKSY